MPFTVSHAIVALPFVRTPLIPAAMAIGGMTPDLPLFVRGTPLTYGLSHSVAGIPITVVVALLLVLVWRCIVRPAARPLMPRWVGARLPAQWDDGFSAGFGETFTDNRDVVLPRRVAAAAAAAGPAFPLRRWRTPVLLVFSLTVGVLSHIIWDSFTHEGRWGSTLVPLLDERWGALTGYTWLQHGSSAVGLAVLGVAGIVWISRRPASKVQVLLPAWLRWSWGLSLPVVLVAAWLWGMARYGPFTGEWTMAHLAYRILPPACAAWGVFALALCVAVQVIRLRALRGGPTAPGPDRAAVAGGSHPHPRMQDRP